MKFLRVGIVGAGLIGAKRAAALKKIGRASLIAVADVDFERAKKLADEYGASAVKKWEDLVSRADLDVIIVSVPNKFTAPIAIQALKNGKHVLCEKPFGRNAKEAKAILDAGKKHKRLIKVGFSNRFHPGIFRAKQLFDQGLIGNALFIRARHGHGGRVGMEKEWRLRREISGGGELLDQGVHIIDLCRWFGGEFTEVFGCADTKYWKTNVDDNAFAIMRNKKITAAFHVSTTNWGNIFSFEVFGEKGALTVHGLGRRYGTETLEVGIKQLPFGDLKTETYTYPPDIDESWEDEWKNFLEAILNKKKLIGDAMDGYRVNRIVDAIYRSSKTKKTIKL